MNESRKRRDIATDAFRLYASLGCPTREAYEEMIRAGVAAKYANESDEQLSRRMHTAYAASKQAILDIDAVNKVMRQLEDGGRAEIIGAIRAVYFEEPRRRTYKGEIEARVLRYASTECPAGRRTVYAWLRRAREMFFRARGMNY